MSTGDEGELPVLAGYGGVLDDIIGLLAEARSAAARQVNQVMTTTY